jgi:hypothetical protein
MFGIQTGDDFIFAVALIIAEETRLDPETVLKQLDEDEVIRVLSGCV